MLVENKKYTLDEIWDTIITYSTEPEEQGEHYFEVEMFDINKENTDLLNETKVREYLSFVVPVPYRNTFILRNHIYNYANSIGYTIDEYCVRVNGSQTVSYTHLRLSAKDYTFNPTIYIPHIGQR